MPMGEVETFEFKGQKRFRCPDCPFDSHEMAMLARHWVDSHAEVAGIPSGPTLFDADDKPLSKRIVVPLPWQQPD